MSSELFPDSEQERLYLQGLQAQAQEGGRAKDFMALPQWDWFKDIVLGSIFEEAVETLRVAKDDAERLRAQMMLLASQKPVAILERLARDGDAAKERILELSTPKEDETNV